MKEKYKYMKVKLKKKKLLQLMKANTIRGEEGERLLGK